MTARADGPLLRSAADFDGVSLGAMKEAASLVEHLGSFRRVALVGGPEWRETAAAAARPFLPVEVRAFEIDDEVEVWGWFDATSVEPTS